MKTGFPLENLFGGRIREFKLISNSFNVKIEDFTLPAHLWCGTINTGTATPVGRSKNEIIATRNKFGHGEVLWMPSLIGLGSRIKKDYNTLSSLLNREVKESIQSSPFYFKIIQKGMLMKTLKSGESYITIIINKSADKRSVVLNLKEDLHLNSSILFADKQGQISDNTVEIAPEETMVIQWK